MNKTFSLVAVALSLFAGAALAQSGAPDTLGTKPMTQLAATRPEVPVMTHELATLIKLSQQAQAQYRRSGSPQDLARVKAMQIELTRRGIGHATQATLAQ